jgi:hypothetical protein
MSSPGAPSELIDSWPSRLDPRLWLDLISTRCKRSLAKSATCRSVDVQSEYLLVKDVP